MALQTTAPLPRLVHLSNLLRRCPYTDDALAKPWLHEGDVALWFSRAAWALRAVLLGWTEDHDGVAPRLWLPDYFCNQSLWPARETAADLQFYPVRADLTPDWQACNAMAAENSPDLFVQVHYFGFPFDLYPARRFCDLHGALLIEDAAHVMVPTGEIGRCGDLVLFSPYKHLAVPDAGLLVIRPTVAGAIRSIVGARSGAAPSGIGWLAKRILQSFVAGITERPIRRHGPGFDEDPPTHDLPTTPSMSALSRKLLAATIADMPATVRRKRLNEGTLRAAMAAVADLTPLFPAPDEGVAPYRAVFRADSPATAVRCFDAVRRVRGLIETWPDLPPEVAAAPERHQAALTLRRTLLLLPNHASVNPVVLERIYRAAAAAIAASRSRAAG